MTPCLLVKPDPTASAPAWVLDAAPLVGAEVGGGPGGNPLGWLGWLGASFLGLSPTSHEWDLTWYEARMVPRNLYDVLMARGCCVWLVNGIPITQHPTMRHLAGRLVGYPGDTVTTFDQIAGVEDPSPHTGARGVVVSIGKLARREHGSIAVLAHELWHLVCRHLHPFPFDSDWQVIWQSVPNWGNPALSASAWECWAETAAWYGALRSLGRFYDGNYTRLTYDYHAALWKRHGWLDWPAGV